MSTVNTIDSINQASSHEENNNNGKFSINRSKVYPSEESAHPDIRNSRRNEKASEAEIEGSGKERRKSFCRRKLAEIIIPIAAIIIMALAFIAIAKYYVFTQSRPELIYINMIWRHGDRAPVHHFPNFTEKYLIAFPEGLGNLTKMGSKQAQQLGSSLQRRYMHPMNITAKQVYIRSTNVRRTIETARYALKGMALSDIEINADLATNVDTAGNPFFDCPVAKQFVTEQEKKYLLRENFTEIYKLMKEELNYTGDPYLVLDTLICLKEHDLILPEWLKDEDLYEKLKFLSWRGVEAHFGMESFNNELQRKIRGGSSLRGVVSRIACKVNYSEWTAIDRCDEKFYGLSAHDMTIASLLSTFSDIRAILGKSPLIGFGANIAFEIWRIDNSYKMKVLYANQWDDTPQDITKFAPGCGDSIKFCNVTKFIDQSRLLFFDDVQSECWKGAENMTSHVMRRSIGADDASEEVDLIQLY
ncbi:unnamed protein product [Litomosoides sigmodontis]|uniref:acid phosphatase n=1 Tax=Litomosoides sigmodontis TaxID=42156 RepID=A0A3P6RZY4_LITSI|nr:unnamed protein product [Litomosoides sigmodontis]